MSGPRPVVDKNWRAESDFTTLCEATAILDDPKRLKAAQAAGKKRADEATTGVEKINGLRRSK